MIVARQKLNELLEKLSAFAKRKDAEMGLPTYDEACKLEMREMIRTELGLEGNEVTEPIRVHVCMTCLKPLAIGELVVTNLLGWYFHKSCVDEEKKEVKTDETPTA